MTSLKELRRDLGAHLAAGLGAAHAKLGAQVNPPAVEVRPGVPYVAALDYCTDQIAWTVTIVTKPGDLPAVIDALDDMVDKVRATLKAPSPAGNQFGFQEVSGRLDVTIGDAVLPGMTVTVILQRQAPNA